jgi:hypothetical protein
MKIKIKYEIEVGEERIECETLEIAERRMKSFAAQELEAYLIKKEYNNNKIINEILVG